jgi:LPS-assembly protein
MTARLPGLLAAALALGLAGGGSTAVAQQSEVFGSSDPFASRFHQHGNFTIQFKAPTRGGIVHLEARSQKFVEKVSWDGEGDVVITYQDVKIKADRAHVNLATNDATLIGHVVIDQGPTRMSGTDARFNIKTKTGSIHNAEADLQPEFHVIAATISKIAESTYRVWHGVFTSCSVPKPAWSFYTAQSTITLDDYARMKSTSFRWRGVPLLYFPYILWPTKQDRASGFLVPGFGYNSQRGAFLGLTYYWVTGRSTDATTEVDMYSRGAFGIGQEFRWAPSAASAGVFQGFLARDPKATVCVAGVLTGQPCNLPDGTFGSYGQQEKTRWKLRLDDVSEDLPWDMRGVVSIRDYSDINFLQDFERSFALNSARQIASTAYLTRNSGDDSFNFRTERIETFFSSDVLQERTPSLEFSHRTARIGHSPLYAALEASFSRLFVNRGIGLPHGGYFRGDIHPTLSLPFKTIPWLSITTKVGGRWTGYSDSTDDGQTHFTGTSVARRYGEASVSLVGPSFSRIYDFSFGPYVKWKHLIEPRIDYGYVSQVEDPQRLPAFDEIDTVLGQNAITYSLVNRLIAKPGGDAAGASTREVATLQLSQTYYFKLPQTLFPASVTGVAAELRGPATADLRLSPFGAFNADARATYDSTYHQVTSTSLTATASWKDEYANLTWFSSRPVVIPTSTVSTVSPNSDQVRAAAGLNLFGKRWRIDTQLNYDVTNHQMLEDRSLLTYNGSCYTIFLEVRELRLPPAPRRDYRLVINLKNIGTLLDMNGALDKLF